MATPRHPIAQALSARQPRQSVPTQKYTPPTPTGPYNTAASFPLVKVKDSPRDRAVTRRRLKWFPPSGLGPYGG